MLRIQKHLKINKKALAEVSKNKGAIWKSDHIDMEIVTIKSDFFDLTNKKISFVQITFDKIIIENYEMYHNIKLPEILSNFRKNS